MWRRAAALVVICGWWATVTHSRVAVWQTDETLWRDAAAQSPTKIRPLLNLARARELAGDWVRAEMDYRAVIGMVDDPRRPARDRRFAHAAALTNLAHVDMKRGRLATAMRTLDETLTVWPDFPYAHYNRAVILWSVGACADAMQAYRLAQQGDTSLIVPHEPCFSAP